MNDCCKWRIQPGAGGAWPPVGGLTIFFASILILLLSRLHTMARENTKVAVCRRLLYFPTGLCLPPFAVAMLRIACRLQQQVL